MANGKSEQFFNIVGYITQNIVSMKKLLVGAGLLLAMHSKAQQFTLKGNVAKVGDPVEWVYLSYVAGERWSICLCRPPG
jgi:hypothetical protein